MSHTRFKNLLVLCLTAVFLTGFHTALGDDADDNKNTKLLFINEVEVLTPVADEHTLIIHGGNFDYKMKKGYLPVVTLSDEIEPLEIIEYDGSSIAAYCPQVENDTPVCNKGDYRLWVKLLNHKGKATKYSTHYDLTMGAVGPQGPKGDQGPIGLTGADGADGLPGEKGDRGDQGPIGLTGADGADGSPGDKGEKGDKGDQGDQGLIGLTGADGADGLPGEKGEKGDKGDQGDQGSIGLTGDDGKDGLPGDKGATGEQGIQGPAGSSGPQGLRGFAGVKGDKGDKGDPGTPGGPKGDKGDQGPPGLGGLVPVMVEKCYTENGLLTDTNCVQKMVVDVAVSYGVETSMFLDATSTLPERKIEVSKTVPRLIYPLKHFHTVAYFPYEEVLQITNSVPGVESCNAAPVAASPSCGWTYFGSTQVKDSQGFCCNKNAEALSNPNAWYRGEEFLGTRSTPGESFSTAHCLRQGELFYHGYEIGEAQMTYDIEVTLAEVGAQSFTTTTFTVSPEDPEAPTFPDETVVRPPFQVELLDKVSAHHGGPDLSNFILYIPVEPQSHPFVEFYQQNMLLVPREEVSKSGSEPDKVGVSFNTFRRMGGECAVSVAGDGLHNQLYHKHNADLVLQSSNVEQETTYLIHGKRWFKNDSMSYQPGMDKHLVYEINDISYSRLSLSMDAERLPTMVEPRSQGFISNAIVQPFFSLAIEGILQVNIVNQGDYRADYIVTVTDVSEGVLNAIPAQARTLNGNGDADLFFDIHTTQNMAETRQLWVRLKSPDGYLYDEYEVIFDTEFHDSKFSWDLLQENDGTQSSDK